MSRWLISGLALLCASQCACAADARPLAILVPQDTPVVWHGMPSEDSSGKSGAMLYPAPNAIGFLVAVLTHAAISSGAQSAEKSAKQAQADLILQPFAKTLESLTSQTLLAEAVKGLSSKYAARVITDIQFAREGEQVIAVLPSYSMSADKSAVVMDNAIKLTGPTGSAGAPDSTAKKFEGMVRVISSPAAVDSSSAAWGNEGQALPAVAGALLAQSIDIAISTTEQTTGPQRTQRYLLGPVERMERGEILSETCDRVLLRTLRSWLVSAPIRPNGNSPGCAAVDSVVQAKPAATAPPVPASASAPGQ